MKFLRIFGIFSLILGFAFNGAFAATDTGNPSEYGIYNNPVCDETGCTYCDDTQCYVCDTNMGECRAGCSNNQYGTGSINNGTVDCHTCPTAYPKSLLGTDGWSATFNLYEGQCFNITNCSGNVPSCNYVTDTQWQNYFGSTYSLFQPKLFIKDKIKFKMLNINSGCDVKTDYCTYELKRQKKGHIPVQFRNASGAIIDTYYVVYDAVWSTQDTSIDNSESSVIYPTFVTPTAPTISGKRFVGWYSAQTGGTQIITPASTGAYYGDLTRTNAGTTIGLSGNTKTLYARYEDVAQPTWITITIDDKNNGTNPTTYSNPTVLYKNTNTAVSNCSGYKRTQSCTAASVTSITTPTLTGYTYGGHYTGTGGSGNQFINNSGVISTSYSPTSDITVFAKWTSDAYKISLNPTNAGSGITYTIYYNNNRFYCDNAGTTQINNGESIFTKCSFTKPTSNNGPFNGYWSEISGGVIYILEGGSFSTNLNNLNITGDMTWYAHYATCDSMIVLNPNGGNFSGTCANEFYPYYDSTTGQWMTPTLDTGCKPTLAGYTFMGYRVTDQNGVKYYDSNLDINIPVWGLCSQPKVELVAEWWGNCNEITFDDNNGMTSVNANNPQHKRTGSPNWWGLNATPSDPCGKTYEDTNPTVNVPSSDNVPAHATFLGYYTTRNTGGSMIFDTSGAATTYGTNMWIISAPTKLYARWQCDTNYVWNANTQTCEQNTASVTYKCYVDDSGKIDNEVTLTNYAVRSLSWYDTCNINTNNPVPDYKWRFSGTNTDYNAGDIIPSWTYGNDQTFTPAYTATFKCNNDYWQTPTGGSAPAAQSVLLGGELIMPNMPCEVKPEYDGWLETNYTWKTSYTQNLTSPVPGAQCQISDLHYEPGNPFPWNCPTDLTFEPLTKFINKPITVSCGQGGTSQTFIMTFENQSTIEQDIINFFNSCGGSCPLDNPSGPHGYNRKVVCATGLENQNLPTTWDQIENDTQGRTCYKTPAGTNVQSILNEISLAQITDLNIYGISYCPQRVTYKCSEDATDVYENAPYAVFEREYTTQTPGTVGCESGLAFSNWKNLDDNRTFNAGITVDGWPYEDPVTLVAQWGGANTYNITYANMANATGSQTGMPNTYTYGTGATIDGVPTREHSIFAGWCTESTLTNCALPQTISQTDTGDRTFWANWECEHPYHIDPDTGACAVCDDDQYWDEEASSCSACPTEFKHSKSGFNWSIDQCYRECPSNTLLGDTNHRCDSNPNLWDMESCNVIARFEDFQTSTGKQIEFKGNSDAGINTCNNPDNVYCPRGFMGCPNAQPYKPMTTRVDFHGGLDGQTLVGTRYIFGSRQGGEGLDIVNGKLWSSLDGPAQKVELNGSPNYYYTHIIYPAQTAPDATVQGYTFNGYYYPRSGGTRYVESDYGLNNTNAASVLNGQPGDYSQTRNLYATLGNGGYTANEYNVTYNCGTGNPPAPESQNGIHYGDSVTPRANTCTKPGYNFQGWIVSHTVDIKQPGVAFTWQYEENKVFTAKWSDDPNTYVITYTPGYTGSGQSNVTQNNITFGTQFQTQGRIFTRTGHIMTGWSEPFPLLSHNYQYNIEGNTTLDAQWQICPNGQTPNEDGTECVPCADNEAGVGGVCNPCPDGMQPNANHTACVPCADNEAGLGGVCNPCPDGMQPNADHTACVPCADNEAGVGGVCNPCPDGMQPNADHTACVPCADNEAGLGGVCNPCPDGTQPNADHTACVPCADNEAGLGGVCNPCPDGTQPNADHTACVPCADNEAGVGGVCNPCPDGTQPNADHTACVPCADNEAGVGGVCNPCPDGMQPNAEHTACVSCADNEAGVGGVCNPCPDGTQPNAEHTACVPCPDGTAGTNGTCEPCAPGYVPNAQATACEPCPAGTYWENGICEPCPEDYSSVPGSVGLDACFLAACPTGQHIAHGACEDDVIICDAPYAATATRTWNPTLGAYGSCQIQECEDGYHVASNACVPNDQLCNVANGRGERAWNGTQWGNCVVTECDPGFEPNASNTACVRCVNYTGADGQPAVSSYVAGCEIATCMYQGQKYALENGECRPICETASDDTGSKHWDNITKKCVRTCNPGYKMW